MAGEKVYYAHYPTNRNIKNLIKNTSLGLVYSQEEEANPDHVQRRRGCVSLFLFGKVFGGRLIYLEVYDF
jgi:beta-1,4-N-acetylglucosaminyltransferase